MGNREGLRDLLLFNPEEEIGISVQTRGNVAFSLQHYSDEHLKKTDHTWELEKGNVYAHFDCYQKGIGNGSCNQVATIDKYLIKNGAKYNCSLLFTPVINIESGIEEVEDEDDMPEGVYDLQGRKVETPKKGIYIINGKKTLIR